MVVGSEIKRNIFTGGIIALVPDVVIAIIAASITDSGLVGFFVVLIGLQVVYILIRSWATF